MAWPEPMAALLARTDSRATQALRWGLWGLRAALRVALDEMPPDPGADQLRALLAEFDPLLERAAAMPVSPDNNRPTDLPPATFPESEAPPPLSLRPLLGVIAEDRRLPSDLMSPRLRAGKDDEIWNAVQRLLLRVPQPLATEWRARCLSFAEQAGSRPDNSRATTLPLPRDEILYPGLIGTVSTVGLRTAAAAPLDPRIAPPAGVDLQFLAGAVSSCLCFIEHDPYLGHCLKNVFRFGIRPLVGDQRERFVAELLRLWERVRLAAGGIEANAPRPRWKEYLRALLDLDEALHSLVYQPQAAPDSWWGRLLDQARAELLGIRDRAIQAGSSVHLQVLGGTFADLNRLAPDSLQVDWGVPGEIGTCLRIWARLEGEELKGRVLYRSPQEEA